MPDRILVIDDRTARARPAIRFVLRPRQGDELVAEVDEGHAGIPAAQGNLPTYQGRIAR